MAKRTIRFPFNILGYFPPLGGGGGGADHNLLSATHLDTVVGSPVRGDLVIANSTPAWARTALGATGRVIRSNALDAIWDVLQHGDLGGVLADQHHSQLHAVAHHSGGGDALSLGSIAGLVAWLTQIDFTSSNLIDIATRNHTALQGVLPDQHHVRLHNLLASADHDVSGVAAAGDILRRNTGNTAWEKLAIGATGDVLQVSGGLPIWASSPPPAGSMGLTRLSLAADGSGAAGADTTWVVMTSDKLLAATGLQTLFTITGVGIGKWHATILYRYQSDVAGSGAGFAGNHTGTVAFWLSNVYVITTGGTAATGTHDQATATVGGQMAEGKAERVKNTLSSTLAGVDTINSDMLAVMHLLFEVTAAGDLVVQGAGEAANDITFKAGTVLELHKIA